MEVEIIVTGGLENVGRRIVYQDGWVLEWNGKGRTADIWSVGMYNFRQAAIASGGTVTDAAPVDCVQVVDWEWETGGMAGHDVSNVDLEGALARWIGGES